MAKKMLLVAAAFILISSAAGAFEGPRLNPVVYPEKFLVKTDQGNLDLKNTESYGLLVRWVDRQLQLADKQKEEKKRAEEAGKPYGEPPHHITKGMRKGYEAIQRLAEEAFSLAGVDGKEADWQETLLRIMEIDQAIKEDEEA